MNAPKIWPAGGLKPTYAPAPPLDVVNSGVGKVGILNIIKLKSDISLAKSGSTSRSTGLFITGVDGNTLSDTETKTVGERTSVSFIGKELHITGCTDNICRTCNKTAGDPRSDSESPTASTGG